MKETRKQLNDLLGMFYSELQARQILSDIEETDRMLASFKGPVPRIERIEQIKEKVVRQAMRRRRKTQMLRSLISAAAACVLIGVGLILFQHIVPPAEARLESAMIQAFFSEQPVEMMVSNLDEISEQIYTVQPAGWTGSWEAEAVEEIEEMDQVAAGDFWKG